MTLVAVLVFTVGLTLPAAVAPPPDSLHWARATPFPTIVTLYDQTHEPAWSQSLLAAATEWNAAIDNVEFRFGDGDADCEKGHGPYTVVVCVHPTAPGNRAETRWYVGNDEHLEYATIWLDPRPEPARVRLSCHELGHALGLRHRTDGNSCMVSGTEWVHPDQQDFQTVTDAHAHLH